MHWIAAPSSSSEKVRPFASQGCARHVLGLISGERKHREILLRCFCTRKLQFWRVPIQDVWRQHNEVAEEQMSEVCEADSENGSGQTYGTAYCVDISGSVLYNAAQEI